MPFSSTPSTNSSRSASSVGDSAIASGRSRSSSSRLSIRKTARWPPESTGFSTAGKRPRRARRRCPRSSGAAAYGGCGSPRAPSESPHRALVRQEAGRLRADPRQAEPSATAATTGTARSADTVSTPSTPTRRATSTTSATDVKSTTSATSAEARPGASALRSTAATRRPRPAPARSHGADGAPRPRREPSSRPPMLTATRARSRRPEARATATRVPAADLAAVRARERRPDARSARPSRRLARVAGRRRSRCTPCPVATTRRASRRLERASARAYRSRERAARWAAASVVTRRDAAGAVFPVADRERCRRTRLLGETSRRRAQRSPARERRIRACLRVPRSARLDSPAWL